MARPKGAPVVPRVHTGDELLQRRRAEGALLLLPGVHNIRGRGGRPSVSATSAPASAALVSAPRPRSSGRLGVLGDQPEQERTQGAFRGQQSPIGASVDCASSVASGVAGMEPHESKRQHDQEQQLPVSVTACTGSSYGCCACPPKLKAPL